MPDDKTKFTHFPNMVGLHIRKSDPDAKERITAMVDAMKQDQVDAEAFFESLKDDPNRDEKIAAKIAELRNQSENGTV